MSWVDDKPVDAGGFSGPMGWHPNIYEQYVNETTIEGSRRFCVPRNWSNT